MKYDSNVLSILLDCQISDVDPVDSNASLGHVVKSAGQVGDRALAGSSMTDYAHHFSSTDVETDVVNDGATSIPEACVFEL